MRWVILGPYPPERGEGAALAAAEVARRLDAGDEVTVISPRPSAAHRHRPLVGPSALWSLHADVAGFDGLWARVEPGMLLTRDPSRPDALLERVLLRRLLRRVARSVLDVGDAVLFPGGRAGGLVFSAVSELIVHSAADEQRLLAGGAPRAKVTLVPPMSVAGPSVGQAVSELLPPEDVPPPDGLRGLQPGADRATIEAAVRARAAAAPLRRPSP